MSETGVEGSFDRRRFLSGAGLAMIAGIAAGCGSSSGGSSGSGLQQIRFMLDYSLPDVLDAWLYVGLHAGYFKQQGIDLRLLLPPNGNLAAPVDFVAVSKADIGFGAPLTLASARGSGAPVLFVGNIIARRDDGVLSLPSAPIHTPKDLIGKTFGNYNGPDYIAEFNQFLKTGGVSPSQVKVVFPAYTPPILAAKKVAAVAGIYSGERIDTQFLIHEPPVWVPYTSWGVPVMPYYGLVTSEQFANKNGDLLKRFLVAAMQGNKLSLLRPDLARTALDACCSIGATATGTLADNVAKYKANAPFSFIDPTENPSTATYGVSDLPQWEEMLSWAHSTGQIPTIEATSSYVTNDFLTAAAQHPTV